MGLVDTLAADRKTARGVYSKREGAVAYKVDFEVPRRPLEFKDVRFTVQRNGKKLGELGISQGGLTWWPKYKVHGIVVNWQDLEKKLASKNRRP